MTTLQEYLNQKYPTKEEKEKVKRIESVSSLSSLKEKEEISQEKFQFDASKLETGNSLDLSNFVNLEHFSCIGHLFKNREKESLLKEIKLGKHPNLNNFSASYNGITSVKFLNNLSNPEKLEGLYVNCNNIQSTDIKILSRFTNLQSLRLGTTSTNINFRNRFYGSLKALEACFKKQTYRHLCIDFTDVDEGLEYLTPVSIECRGDAPGAKNETKCITIQNELRPFNYDLLAWQLAHPEKMLIARPELFTNPDSKDQWIKALTDKITNTQQELQEVKQTEADKVKKIARLESKIKELDKVKEVISQETQTDPEPTTSQPWYQEVIERLKKTFATETKEQETQTELTGEELEKQQKENKELREQINKLIVKK